MISRFVPYRALLAWRAIWGSASMVAEVGPARRDASSEWGMPAPRLDDILGLETEVWQALVDGDAAADERLLAEDFVGVYPTGFAGRDDHVTPVQEGPTVSDFVLAETRLLVVSDTAALLAYRADYRRVTPDGPGPPETMFVSSLWCERDGRWVNVFSQDTPEGAATP